MGEKAEQHTQHHLLAACLIDRAQLYNEEVHDLLAPKQMKLPIHESRENGVYVCGLREDIVTSPNQVRPAANVSCDCTSCPWLRCSCFL